MRVWVRVRMHVCVWRTKTTCNFHHTPVTGRWRAFSPVREPGLTVESMLIVAMYTPVLLIWELFYVGFLAILNKYGLLSLLVIITVLISTQSGACGLEHSELILDTGIRLDWIKVCSVVQRIRRGKRTNSGGTKNHKISSGAGKAWRERKNMEVVKKVSLLSYRQVIEPPTVTGANSK